METFTFCYAKPALVGVGRHFVPGPARSAAYFAYPEASPSRLAPSRPMRCCSGSAPHPCRWSMTHYGPPNRQDSRTQVSSA